MINPFAGSGPVSLGNVGWSSGADFKIRSRSEGHGFWALKQVHVSVNYDADVHRTGLHQDAEFAKDSRVAPLLLDFQLAQLRVPERLLRGPFKSSRAKNVSNNLFVVGAFDKENSAHLISISSSAAI